MKKRNIPKAGASIALFGSLLLLLSGFFLMATKSPAYKLYGSVRFANEAETKLTEGLIEIFKDKERVSFTEINRDGSYETWLRRGKYTFKLTYEDKDTSFPIQIKRGKHLELNVAFPFQPVTKPLAVDSARANKYVIETVHGEAVTFDEEVVDDLAKNISTERSKSVEVSDIDFLGRATERASSPLATPPMEAESAYPVAENAVKAQAGTLTAGELNDFTKFELWTDLSSGSLKAHGDRWGIRPQERYTLLLTNEEGGAVVGAEVQLRDKEGTTLWTSISNNAGRVDVWAHLRETETIEKDYQVHINYQGSVFIAADLVSATKGVNQLALPLGCYNYKAVDIAFIVDATGSMADEIAYLQAELENVILAVEEQNNMLDIQTASLFYRDSTDDYVTVRSDFSDDLAETTEFIKRQAAKGGGDMPEAVDAALTEGINTLQWREGTQAKLLFLVLDAPPHDDAVSKQRLQEAAEVASAKGIRIIPIVASGADKSTEYLMRALALATSGTYLFLTDHSGVGGSHMAPSTDAYEVTYLNQLMKEVITRYTTAGSCHNDALAALHPVLQFIEHVQISEKQYDIRPMPQVELTLKNQVLNGHDDVNKMVRADKDELERLQAEAEKDEKAIYSLFPNPTSGQLNVFTSTAQDRILLLDMTGKLLREFNSNGQLQFSVNVSDYPPGLYLIGFYNEDQLHTERFVLSK